jgi:hypothetical protein
VRPSDPGIRCRSRTLLLVRNAVPYDNSSDDQGAGLTEDSRDLRRSCLTFAKVHLLLALSHRRWTTGSEENRQLAPAVADFGHSFQTLDDMPSANAWALQDLVQILGLTQQF